MRNTRLTSRRGLQGNTLSCDKLNAVFQTLNYLIKGKHSNQNYQINTILTFVFD